jgi:hypothetical protein
MNRRAMDGPIVAATLVYGGRNAMRHFVRFARVTPNGKVDREGWRLRIFLDRGDAGAFVRALEDDFWRVETGQYEDSEGDGLARFHARASAPTDRLGRS